MFWQRQRAALRQGFNYQINVTLQAVLVGYPRVPAGRLVVARSRRRSRGPARHQAPCRHSRVAAAPKSACALDGFGCPTEAPYGCFLPDLTRFGTCRHPNPSNALGARYILPALARHGKIASLGQGFFDYFLAIQAKPNDHFTRVGRGRRIGRRIHRRR